MNKDDRLFLVDGSGYIFRAYHALPGLKRKSDGLPVGAVLGFCNMLWRLLADIRKNNYNRVYLAVIFDYGSRNFRHQIYPDYKANRPPAPEDLIPQFSLIREATRAFQVPCIEKPGYEADDIIATYCRLAAEAGAFTRIVSSDKDLMQLVSPQVSMFDAVKEVVIEREDVIKKWGVPPEQMIDLQALIGDSSDNVPGVPGIGPKTGAALLEQFGDLDNLLQNAATIPQPKRRQSILDNIEQINISKQLVTLKNDLVLEEKLEDFLLEDPANLNATKLISFLKALDFTSLTKRIAASLDADASLIPAANLEISIGDRSIGESQQFIASDYSNVTNQDDMASKNTELLPEAAIASPGQLVENRLSKLGEVSIDFANVNYIADLDSLRELVHAIKEQAYVGVGFFSRSNFPTEAQLEGLSFCLSANKQVILLFSDSVVVSDLLDSLNSDYPRLQFADCYPLLKELFEDSAILKISHNVKSLCHILLNYDIKLASYDDIELLSYIVDLGRKKHDLVSIAKTYLKLDIISLEELLKQLKKLNTAESALLINQYLFQLAAVSLLSWTVLKPRIIKEGGIKIYERIDKPLIAALVSMERAGILIDSSSLAALSLELEHKAQELENSIYESVGHSFNLASPKQLGQVLFEELALPGGEKTKTGQWKTSAQILEELALDGHVLPTQISLWRQYVKLKTTYADALPNYILGDTNRVYTNYTMTATSTARLSSLNPNLQNIPIRTSEGKKIRKAFIAKPGHKLISADYSQIELRLLANMAGVKLLQQAFTDNSDIHSLTASQVFGVPLDEVSADLRRRAKAINFGIIYGISAFGLSKQLSIARDEAASYIKAYFTRFPEILDYMETIKAKLITDGFVETIFGRKIYFPEAANSRGATRKLIERAAINAPLQASAADIIRRAMSKMLEAFEQHSITAKMLLQVHDELVFEVEETEVERVMPIIKEVMENASFPAIDLKSKLEVDIKAASSWQDAH